MAYAHQSDQRTIVDVVINSELGNSRTTDALRILGQGIIRTIVGIVIQLRGVKQPKSDAPRISDDCRGRLEPQEIR